MYSNETETLLATGGLKQEGGTVDEESGNDVPPGAMQEEVRDDIDAKLSPGEFVFPADVVRYFGLAKLMEMRDEAKQGLQKMEDIGQMGNADQVDNAEALHGEEDMEEEDTEEMPAAFAAGGYVGEKSAALYKRSPIKGFEMVPMEDSNGNTIYIPYINGVPQLNVPSGYRVKTGASAAPAPAPEPAPAPTESAGSIADGREGNQLGGTTGTTGEDTTKGYTIDIGGIAQPNVASKGLAQAVGTAAGFGLGVPMLGTLAGFVTDFSNKQNVSAAKAYNDLVASESLGGAFATTGKEGSGGAAANLGKTIADNIALSGLDFAPETIAATTQTAATATITNASSAGALVQAASTLALNANIDPAYALDIVMGNTAKSTPVAEQTNIQGTPLAPLDTTTTETLGTRSITAPTSSVTTSPVAEQTNIQGVDLGPAPGGTLGSGIQAGDKAGSFGFSPREGDTTPTGGGFGGGFGGGGSIGLGGAAVGDDNDGLGFGPQ